MATTVVTPKSATKLIGKQSSLQFPISYTGETGLSSMLAEMIASGKSVEYITTSQFKNGTLPNVPDGYVQAAYQLPGAIQQNVITGSDNITIVKSVDVYVIGSPSDKLTSNFQLKMFQGNFTVGGSATPAYTVGQEILLIFYKNTNIGISSFGAGINKDGLQTANFLASTVSSVRLRYVAPNELIIIETNFNAGIVQKWDTLKTTNKTYLVDALNEIYNLAFAGGAGPAGGVLTGNYPNPTIKADGIVNSMIGAGQVNGRSIAANSVGTSQIIDSSIIGNKILDGAIIRSKLATGAVGAEQLGVDSVIENRIRDLNVSTRKIQDGAITNAKIADGAITRGKIANVAVGAVQLGIDAVVTDRIRNLAVITDKIADLSVTTPKIADGAVTIPKLGSDLMPYFTFGFIRLVVRCDNFIITRKTKSFVDNVGIKITEAEISGQIQGMKIFFSNEDYINWFSGMSLTFNCVGPNILAGVKVVYAVDISQRCIYVLYNGSSRLPSGYSIDMLMTFDIK